MQEILERRSVVAGAESAELVDPDRELVRRWQAGDLDAFESLVRRHQRRVFRLLHRMLGSADEAEDVSQETFLNLHRHGHRFRQESLFSTFVYRVAANAALNRRRSLGRRRSRLQELAARQASGDDLPTAPANPEDHLLRADQRRRIEQALLVLPTRLRLPLVLYDLEGLQYTEIAEVTGVPEGTVKSRIHRARQALRRELGDLVAAKEVAG
jgi:RNA polymerase sigma-70 factor (ECF subfamily)